MTVDQSEPEDGVAFDYSAPPAAAPFVAPTPTLTARQMRLALLAHGVTSAQVDAALAAISDPHAREIAQIEWHYATTFDRSHPLVASLAAILLPDMTSEALDAAWRAAAAI